MFRLFFLLFAICGVSGILNHMEYRHLNRCKYLKLMRFKPCEKTRHSSSLSGLPDVLMPVVIIARGGAINPKPSIPQPALMSQILTVLYVIASGLTISHWCL